MLLKEELRAYLRGERPRSARLALWIDSYWEEYGA